MASLNSPMAEYLPDGGRGGRERTLLVHLQRRAQAKDGFIDLDENVPGLGLTINEEALKRFEVLE